MRVFALSDLHVDYDANANWVKDVSRSDYLDDILILAGDVTDALALLDWCLSSLAKCFRKVLYVPGNHELWVTRDGRGRSSLQKFLDVKGVATSSGVSMQPFRDRGVSIVPLLGWYDYSFGPPSEELESIWMDYYACRWPSGFGAADVTEYFAALNDELIVPDEGKVITFSHFLPRIDLMPSFIPKANRLLYPVLGSTRLEHQLRRFNSSIHIYGHTHVNRQVAIDGVSYVNNAFGYPHEPLIASKRLLCVHEG
jgi:predicted phosphodiesterase